MTIKSFYEVGLAIDYEGTIFVKYFQSRHAAGQYLDQLREKESCISEAYIEVVGFSDEEFRTHE